jgi:hypothetical protein
MIRLPRKVDKREYIYVYCTITTMYKYCFFIGQKLRDAIKCDKLSSKLLTLR